MEKIWLIQDKETDTAFRAFQMYLSLDPLGEGEDKRTYANVARMLGHKSPQTVHEWASRFYWTDRVRAYESWAAEREIEKTLRGKDEIQEYVQQAIISRVEKVMSIFDTLVEDQREDPSPVGFQKLVNSLKTMDDILRRTAGLPMSYGVEKVKEPISDETIFIIGGDKTNE